MKNFGDIDGTDTLLKGQGIFWPQNIHSLDMTQSRSSSKKSLKAKEMTDEASWFGYDASAFIAPWNYHHVNCYFQSLECNDAST
eukprot:2833905-Ditylum_brightwellii.AAC.2